MLDLANKPGLLFVIATLLPLASFLFLAICAGIRTALRTSPEGSAGRSFYELLGGDTPKKWPAFVATGAIALAFICSFIGFIQFTSGHSAWEKELHDVRQTISHLEGEHVGKDDPRLKDARAELARLEGRWQGSVEWLRISPKINDSERGTVLKLGFKIDHLAVVMFVMVTFIATLIHIFSMGYMGEELQTTVEDHQVHGEDGHHRRRGRFGRFFLFLSLFCFSMLNLVLADNLFQVFVSWELVGICSYLLIGFYSERQSASNAANKAFITNRIGDAGFIIGLLVLWTYVGTFNFDEIFAQIRAPVSYGHNETHPQGGQIVRGEEIPSADTTSSRERILKVSPDGSEAILWQRNQGHTHAPADHSEIAVHKNPRQSENSSMPYWMLVVAGLGVFLGCVGKSAQFPLHVWLPDAMEGPTPVSALIHAATMVAAGVYLVGRCFPLFTAEALLVIAYTGAITLFVAATIAVVMTDIKKVLAYSTVSQLGYMMLALGVGGWAAGLFHLVTHAFFKALLFLGSGAVIYGCHHEQEMTKMGGLYAKMRITALTMLMGVLAICGIPGFSGWYSKDSVLASCLGFVWVHSDHALLFILPLLTAGITTFYMFRMWLMTFTGQPRDHHVYEHATEAPRLMTTPLIILAVGAVAVSWGWPFFSSHFPFIDAHSSALEHTIKESQPYSLQADFGSVRGHGEHHGEIWLGPKQDPVANRNLAVRNVDPEVSELQHSLAGNLALAMVILGMVFAFALYYYRVLDPAEAKAQLPGAHRFLQRKWYFDELYSAALVRPTLTVAHWCKNVDAKGIDKVLDTTAATTVKVARFEGRFDNRIIDGLVNLVARVTDSIGGWFRRWQTGYLRSYILFLVLAAVGLFVLMTFLMSAA